VLGLIYLKKLVAFAKKYQIVLVNDNPSFVLNDNPISLLQVAGAKEVALELNSLSKTFNMAGWRVGMVLETRFIDAVLKVKVIWIAVCFIRFKRRAIAALKSNKSWF
jgi:aspartate/methionine/tyrosine aminotransferase